MIAVTDRMRVMRFPGQKLPFSYLMMAILFVIIVIIVIAGIWINYENSKTTIEENANGSVS